MKWQALIIDPFKRAGESLKMALADISQDDLNIQPNPDSNSMGWMVWHLSRIQDRAISKMSGKDQAWISGGWYSKFKRSANPEETGFGHSPQDIAGFQSPDAATLLAYYGAVLEGTVRFVSSLTEDELGRKTDHPIFPTVGEWLAACLFDTVHHYGQVAYLRGLLKGKGWSKL
jgi:hypothetical protein